MIARVLVMSGMERVLHKAQKGREGTQVESSIPQLSRDVLCLYPPNEADILMRYMYMELIEPPSSGEWHSSTSIP